MTCDKIIESICNIVIAVSAAAAAIGALYGINAWKNESLWKKKQEIVFKLNINILKIRNAFNYIRSHKTFSKDFPNKCDINEKPLLSMKKIYEKKLQKLDDKILALTANFIEAEVLLDRKIINEIHIFFNHISRLKNAYTSYFDRNLIFEENITDESDRAIIADVFASDNNNELTVLFNKSIQDIESLLKSYLK